MVEPVDQEGWLILVSLFFVSKILNTENELDGLSNTFSLTRKMN